MAYLGEVPNPVNRGLTRKDTFTGDGSTTTFDLTTAIPNVTENDIEVFVDNVRQEPGASDAYTLGFDGSSNFKRITFTAAPESGSEIYVLSGEAQTQIIVVADGSVTGTKISSTFDISGKTVTLPASVSGLGTGITNDQLAGSIANAKLANPSFTLNGVTVNLGDTTSIAAGTDWQAVKTAGFTAVASEGYFVNTTSGAITMTLPASPSIGDEVSVIDYAGTFDTNNLTVDRNGKNIQGSAADLTVSTERAGFTLVFVDDTQGWLLKDK
jgi:hypothetical protein